MYSIPMLVSMINILLFKSSNCIFSNIDIKPESVIRNSTSITKFICTKKINDYRDFDVVLSREISPERIQIFTNRFNNTAIEITVQSCDYIGAFQLICLSKGEKHAGIQSDIKIGKPPGLLIRAQRCVVYYDEYIDCTIRAPVIVLAMENELRCFFRFLERGIYSRPKAYQQKPKLIKIDHVSKTLTFRWFPEDVGHFPDGVKMVVYGTINDFGTTNHTMDMTPTFRISSNFTVQNLTSMDLQIEFNHGKFSSVSFCHGNLTIDDQLQSLNQRENMRTFDESNQTIIRMTDLRSDTWYKICFHCRRDSSFDTISDIECNRYKTLKLPIPLRDIIIVSIILCIIFFPIAILLIKIGQRYRIKQRGHSEQTDSFENIGLTRPDLPEFIPQNQN